MAYFSSINPLAKKIVSETQLAKNVLKDDWDGLDWRKKEEALDNFFVDRNVREKYNSCTKEHHYAVSFPKLFIQSGEKIIVDMDSDVSIGTERVKMGVSFFTRIRVFIDP